MNIVILLIHFGVGGEVRLCGNKSQLNNVEIGTKRWFEPLFPPTVWKAAAQPSSCLKVVYYHLPTTLVSGGPNITTWVRKSTFLAGALLTVANLLFLPDQSLPAQRVSLHLPGTRTGELLDEVLSWRSKTPRRVVLEPVPVAAFERRTNSRSEQGWLDQLFPRRIPMGRKWKMHVRSAS